MTSTAGIPQAPERGAYRGEDTYDVAIVGYGPAGVTAANLAGQHGLRAIVIERDAEVFPRQRAISLDAEALRIIRNIGLYNEVTSHMHCGVTIDFTGLNGNPFISMLPVPTEHCGDSQANFFHQPWLEEPLRGGVRRFPSVEVRCGWEAEWLEQSQGLVTLRIVDTATGSPDTIQARYLLACDGGSSAVRQQLDVRFAGKSYSEQWMDVQAEVKRPLHSSPHFEFLCAPGRPGVKCPCPGGHHRWEWRINPGEDADEMLKPERVWKLLAEHGVTADDVEVTRSWSYTFHIRKCAKWRIGRVFMVGDAAHVMPPFAGQGVSGAFRDAANLVWKIAAVLCEQADDRLLDTYQQEREPHHDAMTAAAVRMGKLVMPANRTVAWLRDTAFRLVRRIPGVDTRLSKLIVKPTPLTTGYLHRRGKDSPVGHLIKAVTVARPGVRMTHIDEALGLGWAILGLDADPRVELRPDVCAVWEAYDTRFFTVRPGNSVIHDGELGDPMGQLWEWMRQHDICFVAIRPDRYVYAAAKAGAELPAPALATVPLRRKQA